jgi:hypothetical protein
LLSRNTFSFPGRPGYVPTRFYLENENTIPLLNDTDGNVYHFVNVNTSTPRGPYNFGVSTIVPQGQTVIVQLVPRPESVWFWRIRLTNESGDRQCAEEGDQGPGSLRWTECVDTLSQASLYRDFDSSAGLT